MKLRYRVKCHMNITAHCVYTNTFITDWLLFKSFSVIPRTGLQFEYCCLLEATPSSAAKELFH